VFKERLDSLGIIETIFMIQRIYAPTLFGIEKGMIQKSIGPVLNAEMQKQGVYINTVLLAPSQDKLTRARSIQARMRAGAVRFDKEGDWYQPFEEELLRFPRDKHDDQVDAWAYMGLLLDRMWEAPTVVEEEDEEYRLMVRKTDYDSLNGRSLVTGY
jgi:predicted phage terminase large subunit-like protein